MVRTETKGHPLIIVAIVVFIMVIGASAVSAYLFLGWRPTTSNLSQQQQTSCPSGQLLNTQTGQCVTTSSSSVNTGNGQVQGEIYGTVQDSDAGTTLGGTSAKIDVINPSALNTPIEPITVSTSAKTFTSGHIYNAGQFLLLHVYSTEGNGYYDANYSVTVPSSTVLIGNSEVFNLGTFYLTNRAGASSVSETLYNPSGAVLSTTTGSTASTSITSYTATAKTFTLKYQVSDSALSTCWGCKFSALKSSSGSFVVTSRGAVAWLALNSTAVNLGNLQNDGFNPISNPPTGYIVLYKIIPAVHSSSTSQASFTGYIDLDTTSIASSTKLGVWLYLQDMQQVSTAQIGVADGAPTATGAYSGYGLTSKIGIGYPGTTPTRITTSSAGGALLATVVVTA